MYCFLSKLESCGHISSADGLIGLKFGLWLGLLILIGPLEAKKHGISTGSYQNLHPGHLKLSYLSRRWSDWTEIWFVASPHDYIGTLYS